MNIALPTIESLVGFVVWAHQGARGLPLDRIVPVALNDGSTARVQLRARDDDEWEVVVFDLELGADEAERRDPLLVEMISPGTLGTTLSLTHQRIGIQSQFIAPMAPTALEGAPWRLRIAVAVGCEEDDAWEPLAATDVRAEMAAATTPPLGSAQSQDRHWGKIRFVGRQGSFDVHEISEGVGRMKVNVNFLSMLCVPAVAGTRLMLLAEPSDATGAGFRYGLSGMVVESTGGGLELRLHLPSREMGDRVGPLSVYVRAGP